MKRIIFASLVLIVGVTACSTDDPVQPESNQLDVRPEEFCCVDWNEADKHLYVTADCAWEVQESSGWVSLANGHGNGNGVVTIYHDENPNCEPRSTTLTVVSEAGSRDIRFTQDARRDCCDYSVSPRRFDNVDWNRADKHIYVRGDCSWTVQDDCGWVSISPRSGQGNGTITIIHEENPSFSSRYCEIVVRIGTDRVVIPFRQNPRPGSASAGQYSTSAFALRDGEPDSNEGYLQLWPQEFVDADWVYGDKHIYVAANCDWSVEEEVDWLTVSPPNGADDGIITIIHEENPFDHARSTNITIRYGSRETVVPFNQLPRP